MIAGEQDSGLNEEVITVPKLAAEGALSREGAGGGAVAGTPALPTVLSKTPCLKTCRGFQVTEPLCAGEGFGEMDPSPLTKGLGCDTVVWSSAHGQ